MNIWLTSSEGFLGKELLQRLESIDAKTFATNRSQVDLLDNLQVDNFIQKNKIDIIIHNAIKGGRRTREDDASTAYENILMYENIVKNSNKVSKIINFDSAAAFDRRRDICNSKESELGLHVPRDFYGFSKMNIALRSLQVINSYNLRIFNCFGLLETSDRMTKSNIKNYIDGNDIIIFKNKYMDIFYIDDLFSVIKHYLLNNDLPKDINCVYKNKTTLLDVAEMINNLDAKKSKIKILENEMGLSYTGSSEKIDSLNIEFKGLQYGLKFMYESLS